MNNNQTRVLITAIGTMNCTTIISELKKAEEVFYVIGADINGKYSIANSNEVDEFFQFPSVLHDREGYVQYLLNFCKEHNVEVFFCVVDEEVEVVAKHKEDFNAIGITLCLANIDAIITCHNKNLFAEWSEKNIAKYCIKRYENITDVNNDNFPIFIKPVEGRASIGCRKIENMEELWKYASVWDNYIAQEYVTGEIVSVDIVRNRKTEQFEVVQKLELLRNSNGCGIAVEIVDIPEIRQLCCIIADIFNLNGVINAECFITNKGLKIIEINPRLPAGIEYSCMAGLDVVLNALRIARGEACIFKDIKIGAHYAKRYETYEIK